MSPDTSGDSSYRPTSASAPEPGAAPAGGPATGTAPCGGANPSPPGTENTGVPGGGFKTFGQYLTELSTWANYWLSAKRDQARLTVRKIIFYAGLAVLGAVAMATALVVAVVMLLSSLGGWLGHGFGLITPGLRFLGPLLVALAVLGGAVLGIRVAARKMIGASRKQTEMKYEKKRIGQRARFGYDVRDRSTQQKRRGK